MFFLGRHDERKGLQVLLEAAQGLDDDVRLWVAGDGDLTSALRAQYRHDDRIDWLGRISDEEKLARLAGATVVAAPSLGGESFGIVLLEAMAAGTPIVASSIDGYAKVARGGADALLVPPGDAEALRAGLAEVLAGSAEVDERVASGLERADQFSMEALADRYLELYERLL